MRIYLEGIQCDADEAGSVRGTVVDHDDNSLAVGCRDGMITFHTEGTPSFDVTAGLEIGALCVLLSRTVLDAAEGDEPVRERAGQAESEATDPRSLIPGQRDAREARRPHAAAAR